MYDICFVDYKGALYDFTLVAGKIPIPPRYTFGVFYSRYWAYSDIGQMVMKSMRKRGGREGEEREGGREERVSETVRVVRSLLVIVCKMLLRGGENGLTASKSILTCTKIVSTTVVVQMSLPLFILYLGSG